MSTTIEPLPRIQEQANHFIFWMGVYLKPPRAKDILGVLSKESKTIVCSSKRRRTKVVCFNDTNTNDRFGIIKITLVTYSIDVLTAVKRVTF